MRVEVISCVCVRVCLTESRLIPEGKEEKYI